MNNMNEMQAALQQQQQGQQQQQQQQANTLNMNLQNAHMSAAGMQQTLPVSGMVNQLSQFNSNYIAELKSQQKTVQVNGTGGGGGPQQQYVDASGRTPLAQYQMQQQQAPSIPSSATNIQQQLQQAGYVPQPLIQQTMQQQLPQMVSQPAAQVSAGGTKESKGHESRFRIIKTDSKTPSNLLPSEAMVNGHVNGNGLPGIAQQPVVTSLNYPVSAGAFIAANQQAMSANNYQRGRWHVVDIEFGANATNAEPQTDQSFNVAGYAQPVAQMPPPQPTPLLQPQSLMTSQPASYNSTLHLDQSQTQSNVYNQPAAQHQQPNMGGSSVPTTLLGSIPPYAQMPGSDASGGGGGNLQLNGLLNTAAVSNSSTTSIPPAASSHSTNQNIPQQMPTPDMIQQQQQQPVLGSNSSLLTNQVAASSTIYAPDMSKAGQQYQPTEQVPIQSSPKEPAAVQQSQQHSSPSTNALDQTASSLKDIILSSGPDGDSVDSGIHSRINMAMDLVKTHLTSAVKEEIVHLKLQIKQLNEKCARLEQENLLLKQHITADTLAAIESRLSAAATAVTSTSSLISLSSSANQFLPQPQPSSVAGSNPNLMNVSLSSGLATSSSAINLAMTEPPPPALADALDPSSDQSSSYVYTTNTNQTATSSNSLPVDVAHSSMTQAPPQTGQPMDGSNYNAN